MTRYEFLKRAGFSGGALMALLTGCVRTEDSVLNALVQNPNGSTTDPATGTTTGEIATNGGSTTNGSVATLISTAELNKITGVMLTLDLSNSNYAKLKTTLGSYVTASNIVVALSKAGKYVAATVTCSHEPLKQVIFSNGEWFCTAHSARFNLTTGAGLNSNGRKGLAVYKAASDGNKLVVYK